MINKIQSFFASFLVVLFFIHGSLVSQNQEDLEFLNLLPNDQATSISQKLGIESGTPLKEEVIMQTIDEPKFQSLVPKKETQSLPLTVQTFGASLFREAPTTFAPIDLAPAPQDYVLGPGDELRIQLFGSKSISRVIPINREGNILIPEFGVIQVSGLNFLEAKNKIENYVAASMIGTTIDVSLNKLRSIQVFVLGGAFKPGAYTVSSLSNISNVLFFSGGPSESGSLRNIDVKRNGKKVGNFDLYSLLIDGNISSDIKLMSNDVVVINPLGKSVTIRGAVKNPAIYELLDDEGFSDLTKFSSGFKNSADLSKITLSRIAQNGERIYKNLTFDKINSESLKDGDDIFIHSFSNTPRNIIKVVGETSSSGVFAFEEGLKIRDLIKPASILENTYTPFVIIERENLYGSKKLFRTNLLEDIDLISLSPNDIVYVLSKGDIEFLNSILVADALKIISEKDSEKISKFMRSSDVDRYQCKSLKLLAKQASTSSIRFVKSKYFPNPKIDALDQLEFIESCPRIFEEKPYLIIYALENSSVISGEVRNPGIYPTFNISSPFDLLSFAGGVTEKASSKMDIFSDEGQSFKLDLSDETSFSEVGIKSSFYLNIASKVKNEVFSVILEGALTSPGIYGVKQGERLSDVIKRAGGYKTNAYPYGGMLARKSVAEKEKIAFLKSADQLEESIATAISSGRISSTGGDPTLALTSISNLISNLKEIEPIGRVVTEFDLDLIEKYPEKDLLLEPGDRIFIPERMSTITVSGQVLSPTSFSYDPSKKVSNYIDLAGGFSEDADKNRTLVIYPDGRASRVRNWPNSPDLAPGTTLVIPRDPNPFDWLVFSQVLFPIVSNFATSAAAIAALGNNN